LNFSDKPRWDMKLTKTKKRAVLITCILAIAVLFSFIARELLTARYTEVEKVYYSYKSTGSIDYKVYLKPNTMYEEKHLEKDRYYIFKFIDRIEMDFKYEYLASAVAELNTEYSVNAYLQGLHGDENEVLWSKKFVLVPDKTVRSEDSASVINFSLPVYLDNYTGIKESFYLESDVNAPVVLNIVFNVHTIAQTKNGTAEDVVSPNLSIPIGNTVIRIEGEPTATGENKISEMVKQKLPVNKGLVIFLAGLSIAFLIFTIFVGLAEPVPPPDEFERKIARIFREYSERLAGMEHTISYQFSEVINVSSIEDMVKIADEVGQPVFYYKVNSSVERKIEFFVFDNNRIYYMVIFGEIIKPDN